MFFETFTSFKLIFLRLLRVVFEDSLELKWSWPFFFFMILRFFVTRSLLDTACLVLSFAILSKSVDCSLQSMCPQKGICCTGALVND